MNLCFLPEEASPTSEADTAPEDLTGILMCRRCQEQFTDVQEYMTHKAECARKAEKHHDPVHSDPEDMVVSEDDEEEDETSGKRTERIRRHRQDAANNNSVEADEENGPRLHGKNLK